MGFFEALESSGLTGYESKLYSALLAEGPLSGYEAAKVSGISRSNVYIALEGLQEKGGANKINGSVVKYTAVPVEEYCLNKERAFQKVLECIRAAAPERQTPPDAYITISGADNIKNKMKNLVLSAQARVYVSQSESECRIIEDELKSAVSKGIKVVIVTSEPFSIDGAEIYYKQKEKAQVRLISDSAYILTGTLQNENSSSSCLYTCNKTLITLFKENLRNEIDLIKIKSERE